MTRLAYESHLRRGHSAKARDYQPQIRLKRRFVIFFFKLSTLKTESDDLSLRFGLKVDNKGGGEGRSLAQVEKISFIRIVYIAILCNIFVHALLLSCLDGCVNYSHVVMAPYHER